MGQADCRTSPLEVTSNPPRSTCLRASDSPPVDEQRVRLALDQAGHLWGVGRLSTSLTEAGYLRKYSVSYDAPAKPVAVSHAGLA